jgi:hypothetical protein
METVFKQRSKISARLLLNAYISVLYCSTVCYQFLSICTIISCYKRKCFTSFCLYEMYKSTFFNFACPFSPIRVFTHVNRSLYPPPVLGCVRFPDLLECAGRHDIREGSAQKQRHCNVSYFERSFAVNFAVRDDNYCASIRSCISYL